MLQNKLFEKLGSVLIYILLFYLPLYEVILHFLLSYTKLSEGQIFWLCHFYEPLIILFFILFALKALVLKQIKLNKADIFISAFLLLAILSVGVHVGQISRSLEGLRFLILPYGVYLLVRLINYSNTHKLILVYTSIASAIAGLGIFEYFFLPAGYMGQFLGLDGFGFGNNTLISTAQATSILAGPNQLASYLILPLFYYLHRFFASGKNPLLAANTYLLALNAIAIGLTYSRSALIGVLFGVLLMFIFDKNLSRYKISTVILFAAMAVGLAISYALYNGEFPRDLLLHGSSMTGHWKSLTDSISKFSAGGILSLLFGIGVGTAGPAALKLGGIISENYFLQVVFEVGLLGLFLLLAFIYQILRTLWRESKTTFFAFIALIINALFLHIFADNPAMSVTVFVIIATIVNIDEKNRQGIVEVRNI